MPRVSVAALANDVESHEGDGVSVVIPSYGRFEALLRCVGSLRQSTPLPGAGVDITVVTSRYGPAELSVLQSERCQVVLLDEVASASRSRNIGARGAPGRYLLFLDDDNVVAPDMIWWLWRSLQNWTDACMVGPAMYYDSIPTRVWCAGVTRSRFFMKTKLLTNLPPDLSERVPSEDFPNCFMVRRSEFIHVMGFDEGAFPQHMEEADLARRLVATTQRRIYCVPRARLWHSINPSLADRLHLHSPDRAYLTSRSRTLFMARYASTPQWLAYLLIGQWALLAVHCWAALTAATPMSAVVFALARGTLAGAREGNRVRRQLKKLSG